MKKKVLVLIATLVMTMGIAAPVCANPSPTKPVAPKTGETTDASAALGGIVILGGVVFVSASKLKKSKA